MNDLFRASEVLYWVPTPETRNFGDYITDLFLEKLLVSPRVRASRYRFVGSIIDNENIERDLKAVLDGGDIAFWGCGARDAVPVREDLFERCRFFGVRGPLTRDLLGLPGDTPLGDPGLLLPLVHPKPKSKRGGTICAPHIFEPMSDEALLASTGADRVVRPEISPSLSALGQLLDEIAGADFVLAGAMHAAIVAHAYGVPFAFFDAGHLDVPFKWRDFAASIGAPVAFVDNLKDGRTAWADLIQPAARRLPLSPMLAACPWFVRPSIIAKAAAHDEGVELDPRVLARLRAAGFEDKPYRQAAADSERRLQARVQAQFDAQAEGLARAQAKQAELDAALAERTAALRETERALGRWMADADRLAAEALAGGDGRTADLETELAVHRQDLQDLNSEIRAFQADFDQVEARAADLEVEVDVRRHEVRDLAAELGFLDEELGAAERRLGAARVQAENLKAELEEKRRERLDLDAELAGARVETRRAEARWDAAERRRAELEASLDRVATARADLDQRLSQARAHSARLEAEAAVSAQERRILDEAVSALEARHGDLLRRLGEAEARGEGFARELEVGRTRELEARLQDRVKPAGLGLAWPWADALDLGLARLFARSRAWRAAERAYGRMLARRPCRAAVLVQCGHALKEQGEIELAAAAYAQAFRLTGPEPDTVEHLAFALRATGRADEAEALAGEHAYPPDLPRAAGGRSGTPLLAIPAMIRAVQAAKAGDWPLAAGRWAKVVRAAPDTPRAWVQYGHALKESGRLQAAFEAYLRALRLDPGRGDAHLQIGHALKLLDRGEEAERAYARAFALSPSDARIRVELAALGRTDAELIDLVLASGARPEERRNSLAALVGRPLAKLAAKRGDWAGATRRYRRLLASAPGDWKSWVQLGHALKAEGRLDEARGAYLEAILRRPAAADPHLQLGHLLKISGERALALAAYDRACRLGPAEDAWREARALRDVLEPAAPPEPPEDEARPETPSAAEAPAGVIGREARLRGVLTAALAAEEDR
jgi:tetratricopeptide (TPR) repeat protein